MAASARTNIPVKRARIRGNAPNDTASSSPGFGDRSGNTHTPTHAMHARTSAGCVWCRKHMRAHYQGIQMRMRCVGARRQNSSIRWHRCRCTPAALNRLLYLPDICAATEFAVRILWVPAAPVSAPSVRNRAANRTADNVALVGLVTGAQVRSGVSGVRSAVLCLFVFDNKSLWHRCQTVCLFRFRIRRAHLLHNNCMRRRSKALSIEWAARAQCFQSSGSRNFVSNHHKAG